MSEPVEFVLEKMLDRINGLERRLSELESSEYNHVNRLYLTDGVSAPSTDSGWAIIYVDTSDGDLKVKFGDGTVKTITADT